MMETGYEVKGKEPEGVCVTTSIDEFMEVRGILLDEYERQKRNERIHNIPMKQTIKKLHDIYENTYNFLTAQEDACCNAK